MSSFQHYYLMTNGLLDDPCYKKHEILLQNAYSFIGYHGTNLQAYESMLNGLDIKYIETGSGSERGIGFYVSRDRVLADDYAESSTQFYDKDGSSKKCEGNQGVPCTLRIYAKDFRDMSLNVDYRWGIQKNAGDPNGDLGIEKTIAESQEKERQERDKQKDSEEKAIPMLMELARKSTPYLELVFSPNMYKRLIVIMAEGKQELELTKLLNQKRPNWEYLLDLDNQRYLMLLKGDEKPEWPLPLLFKNQLKRESSDPGLTEEKISNVQKCKLKKKFKVEKLQ